MTAIFHIAVRTEWDAAELDGIGYAPSVFVDEGFIHCSTREQVLPSAERHFVGTPDLLLVELESDALGSELRWEPAPSLSEDFPHLYRRIVAADVRGLAPLSRVGDGAGLYAFPAALDAPG